MRQIILLLLLLLNSTWAEAQSTTLRQEMQRLQTLHGLHFVYASDLNLDRPYTGPTLEGLEVKDALNHLFYNQGIRITRRHNNIILNATGIMPSRQQTAAVEEAADTSASRPLKEIIVQGKESIAQPNHSRMGESTLKGKRVGLGVSALSTPDLLKTLQHTSGVSAGYELGTDFYVHGGGGDENLVLVDGTPLYSTGHLLGIFSSFNTDMIDSVNFYKSNFPSRYSGRLSSVTDVSIRDGNMDHFKGLFSLGMLEGRLQAEGPIVKGRTSYNVGIRRSWSDILYRPILFLASKAASNDGDMPSFGFDYHDFNVKLTHKLGDTDKLWLSLYSGRDFVDVETKDRYTWNAEQCEETKTRLQWRKWNGTLGWRHQFTPTLSSEMALIGTFNHSLMALEDKYYKVDQEDRIYQWNLSDRKKNETRMFDLGARADFLWQAHHRHKVQLGGQLMYHGFRPQSSELTYYYGNDAGMDTTSTSGSYRTHSQEFTVYMEDAITLSPRLTANVGTSLTLLKVKGSLYPMLDPRLSLDYRWSRLWMASLSCTHMSQHVHRLSPSLLALPTDFWVPSTAKVRPSGSWQFAAGIHGIAAPSSVLRFSLEAFYKQSRHLLTYRDWMGIQPIASHWENDVTSGSGRSWGMEADVILDLLDGWGPRPPRHGVLPVNYLQFSYTLSWTQRQFRDIYDGWYPDQFDNRHKLDIIAHFKLGRKAVFTAAWSYHTGNRITLPEQFGFMPIIPGHDWRVEDGFIYNKPNNFKLPAYHRLDLGMDFHHTTKRGFERIWNVSLYNAYCHMNTLFVEMRCNNWAYPSGNSDGNAVSTPSTPHLTARSWGYIPIIPSFSYTLKF